MTISMMISMMISMTISMMMAMMKIMTVLIYFDINIQKVKIRRETSLLECGHVGVLAGLQRI